MALLDPQPLHPALWLASQLSKGATSCVDTGIPVLSHQLPGGGWPVGVLTELLLPQAGIGEVPAEPVEAAPAEPEVIRRGKEEEEE